MLILILTIIGVIFGALTFFGLTGPRLFKYAKDVTSKRSRIQIAYLVFTVAMTGAFIFIAVESSQTLGLVGSLAVIALIPLMWFYALIDVWKLKLSKRGAIVTNIVRIVIYFGFLSLMIGSIVSNNIDEPLWQKLVPFLGGTAAGVGLLALDAYLGKKREKKRISQEVSKDPPL